jgi:uncharacterized protein (UPF0261 family)
MAEEMLGGNGAGGPDRVLAAAESGVPQVVATSGFDLLAVGGQLGWEQKYAGRAFAVIDELRVLVRTSADECRAIARELAARLNVSCAPFLVLLPLQGWSSLDRVGCALHDPVADRAFADELAAHLDRPERIRSVDANLYSAEFGVACVDAFLEVWAEAGNDLPGSAAGLVDSAAADPAADVGHVPAAAADSVTGSAVEPGR